MKSFKNIHILGGSHVSAVSIENVKKAVSEITPDIIALELDIGRVEALRSKEKPSKKELLKILGMKGFLFYVFGEFVQKKFGKAMGIEPGSEMMAGLDEAEKNKIRVVLIDRNIGITLRRFSKYFKKREILKMILDSFTQKIKFDINDITEDAVEKVLDIAKTRYPTFHKVLVDERDYFMARNLYQINKENPDAKILAIVGAGHVKGMMNYLTMFESQSTHTIIHK
jgi:pheromone shutdown-related protein TraB